MDVQRVMTEQNQVHSGVCVAERLRARGWMGKIMSSGQVAI